MSPHCHPLDMVQPPYLAPQDDFPSWLCSVQVVLFHCVNVTITMEMALCVYQFKYTIPCVRK